MHMRSPHPTLRHPHKSELGMDIHLFVAHTPFSLTHPQPQACPPCCAALLQCQARVTKPGCKRPCSCSSLHIPLGPEQLQGRALLPCHIVLSYLARFQPWALPSHLLYDEVLGELMCNGSGCSRGDYWQPSCGRLTQQCHAARREGESKCRRQVKTGTLA